MTIDREMQRALEADGEKLRQLTGEDHGPVFLADPPEVWNVCEACDGAGGYERHCRVYEAGCGFAHDDSEWVECEACGGFGGMICEAEGER
jgi:hypothetical protein